MTVEEVVALGGSIDKESTSKCPSFINTQIYWLGSAGSSSEVWIVYGGDNYLFSRDDYNGYAGGIRPVIEVQKSSIQ